MNQKQFTFVNEYLRHGDKIVAYTIAYGNSSNYLAIESAANRLLRSPDITEYVEQMRETVRCGVEQELKEKYKEELLTIYDKRLMIKHILTGEKLLRVSYRGKGCTQCHQYEGPTHHMFLQYMKEDSRLAGHYPSAKAQKQNIKSHNISQPSEASSSSQLKNNNERDNTPGEASSTSPLTNNNERVNTQHIPPLKEVSRDSRTEDVRSRTTENHNKSQHAETPLLFLGGGIGDVPMAQEPIGVVHSRTTKNDKKPTTLHIAKQLHE